MTRKCLLGLAAGITSLVASVVFFVLVGLVLPMAAMMVIHGAQAVQDSPAHGGVILFLTVPFGGALSLLAGMIMAVFLYQKWSGVRK